MRRVTLWRNFGACLERVTWHCSSCIMALCVWRPGFLMKTQFYTRLKEKGYDFDGVRKWEKQEDLLEYGKIVVPINFHDFHWALAIINLRDKLFQYPAPIGWSALHTRRPIVRPVQPCPST